MNLKENKKQYPCLISDRELAAGEYIRLWHCGNQGVLFEHLLPSGQTTSIQCPTLEEGLTLWQKMSKGVSPNDLSKTY
jgi:hypothetical protein